MTSHSFVLTSHNSLDISSVTAQNMLRAIENMGIEMSFGIIFIGNGELSKKDYARYIEKHKLRQVREIKKL